MGLHYIIYSHVTPLIYIVLHLSKPDLISQFAIKTLPSHFYLYRVAKRTFSEIENLKPRKSYFSFNLSK